YPERPRLHLVIELLDVAGVIRVKIGSEAKGTVVCQANRFVKAAVGHDGDGGTKRLLTHDPHRMIHIGQYRWLVKITVLRCRWTPSSGQNIGPMSSRIFHMGLHPGSVGSAYHRADVGGILQPVTQAQTPGILGNAVDEGSGDALLHIHSLGRGTDLAGV